MSHRVIATRERPLTHHGPLSLHGRLTLYDVQGLFTDHLAEVTVNRNLGMSQATRHFWIMYQDVRHKLVVRFKQRRVCRCFDPVNRHEASEPSWSLRTRTLTRSTWGPRARNSRGRRFPRLWPRWKSCPAWRWTGARPARRRGKGRRQTWARRQIERRRTCSSLRNSTLCLPSSGRVSCFCLVSDHSPRAGGCLPDVHLINWCLWFDVTTRHQWTTAWRCPRRGRGLRLFRRTRGRHDVGPGFHEVPRGRLGPPGCTRRIPEVQDALCRPKLH